MNISDFRALGTNAKTCPRRGRNSSTRTSSYWNGSVKEGKASLGLAAELADLTLWEMINTLTECGVQSNLETEDYLKGLENLRKAW